MHASHLVLGCLLLAACAASTTGVQYETGRQAATTGDGLHRVRAYRTDALYARPGSDLGRYTGFVLAPVAIAYREPRPGGEARAFSPRERERFERTVERQLAEAFAAHSTLERVAEAGPDVLRLRAEVVDLALGASRRPEGDRIDVWVTTEFRLLLDLADSLSGTSLVRMSDSARLHPSSTGYPLATGGFARPSATQVTTLEEEAALRASVGNRARAFCEHFERLRSAGPLPEPP